MLAICDLCGNICSEQRNIEFMVNNKKEENTYA
jgi:hypothetical protein